MRASAWQTVASSLALLLAGCASLRVGIDFDQDVDFAPFCTYAWLGVPPPPTGEPLVDDNDLLEKRVRQSVDSRMSEKGLTLADPELADITIHYHAGIDQRTVTVTSADYEVYGDYSGVAPERTEVIEYTQGTLILDVHQASTKELIWRAIARDAVEDLIADPQRLDEAMDYAVGRMLARFPPKGKLCKQGGDA